MYIASHQIRLLSRFDTSSMDCLKVIQLTFIWERFKEVTLHWLEKAVYVVLESWGGGELEFFNKNPVQVPFPLQLQLGASNYLSFKEDLCGWIGSQNGLWLWVTCCVEIENGMI